MVSREGIAGREFAQRKFQRGNYREIITEQELCSGNSQQSLRRSNFREGIAERDLPTGNHRAGLTEALLAPIWISTQLNHCIYHGDFWEQL